MNQRWRASFLPLLAVATLTAGCSGSDSTAVETSAPVTSSASTGAPASSSATTSALPEGDSRAAEVDGLSFRLPKDFKPIDISKALASNAADNPDVKDLAGRLGLEPTQMVTLFKQIDYYAVSSKGAQPGFTNNVNVLDTGSSTMPTEDQVRQQFTALGGDVTALSSVTLGGMPAVIADYTLTTASGTMIMGEGMLVQTDAGVIDLTISSSSQDVTQRVGQEMQATLTAASA